MNKPDLPQRRVQLNLPQVAFANSQKKQTYLEWGRSTGKSTVIAWRKKDIVKFMPRSKTGLVGQDYQQLMTRTLPSTIEGLELLGFKKDIHYFFGKRPPKEWRWPEAFQPPLNYENYFSFYNGTGFQLISLDKPDSGRGLNLDAVIGDESALFNIDKLGNNVLTSNRGNIDRFKHTWLHHSLLFCSSTPTTLNGRWFINQEQNAKKYPEDILYMIANSQYNAHNLGADFFKQNKRLLTDLIYNAEIMCIRPGKVQTGFYPTFDETKHTHYGGNDNYIFSISYDSEEMRNSNCNFDADLNKDAPIDVAFDYGSKINCVAAGQDNNKQYTVLNGLFVKSPLLITDLVQKFCDYYSNHRKKEVNYYYDHTAVYRNAASNSTFADEVTAKFEANGWKVNRIYVGQAPFHSTKYLFFGMLFSGESANLPHVSYNKNNCKNLIISMQQAGAKEGPKGTEKDKRPEHRANAVDEETTHFSDAGDTLIYFKLRDRVTGTGWLM